MASELEAIHAKLRDDLVLFGVTMRKDMAKVKSPEFHYDIGELWRQRRNQVCIQAPRGTAKSEICGVNIPLHHITYDEGDKFILLVSKTSGHAKDLLTKIKDVLSNSEAFGYLFGRYTKGDKLVYKWNDDEIRILYKNPLTGKTERIRILAKGMSMMLVGLNYLSQRPTLIILDDPEDDENTKTKDRIYSNYKKLKKSLIPALDPERGLIWVIGTPQCYNGMVNRLENLAIKTGTGEEIEVREGCEAYEGDWLSLRYSLTVSEERKETLWPEWISWEKRCSLKKEAEMDGTQSLYYSEYECKLIGDGVNPFLPQDIHYYEGKIETDKYGYSFLTISKKGNNKHKMVDYSDKPLKLPVTIGYGVDPASSEGSRADYSTIVPIAYTQDKEIFVLPYFRERVSPFAHATAILDMVKTLPPNSIQIESQGYQVFLRDYIKEIQREENIPLPGIEAKWTTTIKKEIRLLGLSHFFKRGKIHIMPNMEAMEDEIIKFPKAKHDDLLDGLWYATRRLKEPYHNVEEKDVYEPEHRDRFTTSSSWQAIV